jgi:hypothetical protein
MTAFLFRANQRSDMIRIFSPASQFSFTPQPVSRSDGPRMVLREIEKSPPHLNIFINLEADSIYI